MSMQLKSIKVVAAMSEETNCYTAKVYLNGKAVAKVGNRGMGGPDEFMLLRGTVTQAEFEEQALAAMIADGFPARSRAATVTFYESMDTEPPEEEEPTFNNLFESWCGEAVATHLFEKNVRNALRRRALFTIPGKTGVFNLNYKGGAKPDDWLYAEIKKRYPGAVVFNEMAFGDAVNAYRECIE